jgi:serine/threonine-protein kinase
VIKDQLHHGEGIARFQREARTAASLSHPHIVTVHDFGIDEMGSPYLVMELLEGRSLRAAIRADGRMSTSGALPILGGLASAIDAAHAKGVIHRDLKPENVFLTTDSSAKILDYGIAKPLTSAMTFSTPGVGMGTLGYMAPEQASGGDAAPAWDVWALTVIAFEMLTGQHPFGGGLPVRQATPIKTLAPDLPDDVADAIDAALSLTPSERPGTATGLLRSFKAR